MKCIAAVKENKWIGKIILSITFLTVITVNSYAQPSLRIEGKSIMDLRYEKIDFQSLLKNRPEINLLVNSKTIDIQRDAFETLPLIPSAYQYDELGIFCKWEVQIEKASRIPLKFRLGEVQYVERMEGKLK